MALASPDAAQRRHHRIGRSLREKGFLAAALDADVEAAADARLTELLATHATVSIERNGHGLTDRVAPTTTARPGWS